MIFGKSQAIAFAAMQAEKGTAATITGADVVDFNKDSPLVFPKSVQMIERGLNRFGPYPSKQAVVGRRGGGGYNLELRGSGTAGQAPSGLSPFLETLFGTKSAHAAGTVIAASGEVGGFDSALNLVVGQLVKINIAAGQQIRIISGKTGEGPYSYTVSENFSQAPADAAVIHAGVSYFLVPGSAGNYFTLDQYISSLRYLCVDAFSESMTFSLSDEDVIKTSFEVQSISCTKTNASNPYTAVYEDTAELVGLECNLSVGGELTNLKTLELQIGSRRTRGGVNSTGISDAPFRSTIEASGSLTPWKEDGSYFDSFFAGELADIHLLKGDPGTGEQLYMLLKGCQYIEPELTDDEDDFQWNLPFNVTGGAYFGFF